MRNWKPRGGRTSTPAVLVSFNEELKEVVYNDAQNVYNNPVSFNEELKASTLNTDKPIPFLPVSFNEELKVRVADVFGLLQVCIL